jgi:hypothetical protein
MIKQRTCAVEFMGIACLWTVSFVTDAYVQCLLQWRNAVFAVFAAAIAQTFKFLHDCHIKCVY